MADWLTQALVIDEQGFAKYSRLYPGNQAEGETLGEIIELMITLRPELASNRTVILDKGLATEDNITYLKVHENIFEAAGDNRSFTGEVSQCIKTL